VASESNVCQNLQGRTEFSTCNVLERKHMFISAILVTVSANLIINSSRCFVIPNNHFYLTQYGFSFMFYITKELKFINTVFACTVLSFTSRYTKYSITSCITIICGTTKGIRMCLYINFSFTYNFFTASLVISCQDVQTWHKLGLNKKEYFIVYTYLCY
jgi:hypothetical protein